MYVVCGINLYADLGIPCTLCAPFLVNSKSSNVRVKVNGKKKRNNNKNKKRKRKKE
jgi:hypothetical protein